MKTSIVLVSCDLCGREEETRENMVLIKQPDGWYTILITKEGKSKEGVLGVYTEDDPSEDILLDVCAACYNAKVRGFVGSLVNQKVTVR